MDVIRSRGRPSEDGLLWAPGVKEVEKFESSHLARSVPFKDRQLILFVRPIVTAMLTRSAISLGLRVGLKSVAWTGCSRGSCSCLGTEEWQLWTNHWRHANAPGLLETFPSSPRHPPTSGSFPPPLPDRPGPDQDFAKGLLDVESHVLRHTLPLDLWKTPSALHRAHQILK